MVGVGNKSTLNGLDMGWNFFLGRRFVIFNEILANMCVDVGIMYLVSPVARCIYSEPMF